MAVQGTLSASAGRVPFFIGLTIDEFAFSLCNARAASKPIFAKRSELVQS